MPPAPRVLLVDDDEALALSVGEYLRLEGFAPAWAGDAKIALAMHDEAAFDILVIDVMMPGTSGFDLLRRLRRDGAVPVLMLTARAEEMDRVLGLELGADDYLAKPFHLRELAARLRAVLRRLHPGQGAGILRAGPLTLDRRARSLLVDGRAVRLTGAEFALLEMLMREPGVAQSRARLSQSALGRPLEAYDRSIDAHVSNLRGKLGLGAESAIGIRAVRGMGYVLSGAAEG